MDDPAGADDAALPTLFYGLWPRPPRADAESGAEADAGRPSTLLLLDGEGDGERIRI